MKMASKKDKYTTHAKKQSALKLLTSKIKAIGSLCNSVQIYFILLLVRHFTASWMLDY